MKNFQRTEAHLNICDLQNKGCNVPYEKSGFKACKITHITENSWDGFQSKLHIKIRSMSKIGTTHINICVFFS